MAERSKFAVVAAALMVLASARAVRAADPLDPLGPVNAAAASPLRQVTIATADPAATRRFFVEATGMTVSPASMLANAEVKHFSLKGSATSFTFTRAGVAGAATVRAIVVPGSIGVLRPKHDALAVGGLAMGMPVRGQASREGAVTAAGFRSAVGVTRMTLQGTDGAPYSVEEIHYQAPDGVLVLGIDRGVLKPVGPIDAASGIGGPAYSSIVVSNLEGADRFMKQVLGYEMRRDAIFTSAGSKGGLGLPDGTRFAFQQWFAPGSSTGYVILMKMIDRPVDPAPVAGFARRGIVMWSFDVIDVTAAEARARAIGARIIARAVRGTPSLIVAMPDGFLVELTPRKGAIQ